MSRPHPALRATDLSGACWRKSSYSGGANDCVEIADLTDTAYAVVAIRDSKEPHGPALLVAPDSFEAFIRHVTRDRSER
ncbi:DUF397 domain-containing protein [Streptomyces malaysiensis]|uniref:DUF397 domain-containing protein n=1 Tax=Streptomyces malaysiensis TaxID=92644 RepID=A0A2J7YZL9_STRMQ|nr:DUF397 domain-containing protein [Streptomyces malaysiensis]PNG93472.1 hypothetical protein SMF913_28937 [Streptomyces malaysiensis]